jgi:PIN domain nuclease of toxin-antitoxin system
VRLLLDTHLLLWASLRVERLPPGVADMLSEPTNQLLFSVVTIWEVAIKFALRRADFTTDPVVLRQSLIDNGYTEIPVTGPHALAVATLPHLHRDPFDRLLVAQAIAEGITLLTADPLLARYPAPVRLV